MLQNPCKTLGFKKKMVYKIPPGGGEVNHIQSMAYKHNFYTVNSCAATCTTKFKLKRSIDITTSEPRI